MQYQQPPHSATSHHTVPPVTTQDHQSPHSTTCHHTVPPVIIKIPPVITAHYSPHITTSHHTLPPVTPQCHQPPHSTTSHHAVHQSPRSTISHHAVPSVTTQYHQSPHSTTSHHAVPSVTSTISHHAVPPVTTQYHQSPHSTTCHHTAPPATMQCHQSSYKYHQHSTRLVRHDLALAFGCVVDSSGGGLVVAPLSWPAPNPSAPPKSMFGSGPRRSANSLGSDEELHIAPLHADPSAAQTPKNHSPLLRVCF
jgi:hypothetical protein